jgi:flavin reductase (DIM6/NTAB) family NADH-FMN oxidoreductase RutF
MQRLSSIDVAKRGKELRRAFSQFPTGVAALCASGPTGPVGMAASSFTSVSLEPPLVSVCIAGHSSTWPRLSRSRRIGISVLGSDQSEACAALASRGADRFTDITWHASNDGAVFITGSPLWLDCRIDRTFPSGDHEIVLLEVLGMFVRDDLDPLLFHRSIVRPL